jgi:predicted outer membrane repeat protein
MCRFCFLLAALVVTADLSAAVLTVGTTGGCDHASVQAALDAAANGDEIRVRTDTYNEVVFVGKSVRIIGGFVDCTDATPTEFQKATISAPAGSDAPVVSIASSTQVELVRLILTSADHAGEGGGLLIGSSSNVAIELTEFVGNSASQGGGAYVGQSATLRTLGPFGAIISGNTATSVGGGIYVRSLATLDFETLPAALVSISDNVASSSGGGIFHGGRGTVLLSNTTVDANHADFEGGGIYSGPATGPALIRLTDVAVQNNTAPHGAGLRLWGNGDHSKVLEFVGGMLVGNAAGNSGGGANLSGTVEAIFEQVEVRGNQAGGQGGALIASGGTVLIESSQFLQNTATTDGGALSLSHVNFSVRALLAPAVFAENTAGGNGGAIRQVGGSGTLGGEDAIHLVRFLDNEGSRGAAIHLGVGQLQLANPLEFIGNRATLSGGAIYATDGAWVTSDGAGSPQRRIVLNGNVATVGGAIHLFEGAELEAAWLQIGGAQDFGSGHANAAAAFGGGLALERDAHARLYNSVVAGNVARTGGGIIVFGGNLQPSSLYFGAVYPEEAGNPETGIAVEPCLLGDLAAERYCAEIEANRLDPDLDGYAGAVLGWGEAGQADIVIERAAIRDNDDEAILARGNSVVELRNALVSGHANVALAAYGTTELGTPGNAVLTLDHSTVTANGTNTIGLQGSDGTAALHIHRSILWGNTGGLTNIGGSIESSCNITQSAGINGLMLDPLLTASDRGAYRLHFDSPALDLCVDSFEVSDLDGAPRPQGMRFDAGAFEGMAVQESVFTDGFEE